MAKGTELRAATIEALIAGVMKVAAIPLRAMAQRRSENQGRKGETIGNRNDAGDEAGENIRRLRPEEAGCRVPVTPGNTIDRHFGRFPQGLCDAGYSPGTDSSELRQFSDTNRR
jgi:hypothetical protein